MGSDVVSPAAAAAAGDDEIIFDMLSLINVFRSGRVERFEPFEFLPASTDLSTGVQSKDIIINPTTGLSVRLYLPPSPAANTTRKLPILIFFHGGGFCVLRAASAPYHNYLNCLTARAGVLSVSVDYRLAPEHPLPAAYDDSWETFRWVTGGSGSADPWLSEFGNMDKVIISGDSAGGNIAHNLGMRLGMEGVNLEGLVLMNPYFWGKERIGGEGKEKDEVMAKVKFADAVWPFLCPGTAGLDDPRLNPVADGAPSLAALGFRRVLVVVGELDFLLDRGNVYCEKLRDSGWRGEVDFMEAEGVDHGFFLDFLGNEKAGAFMELFVNFCNKE